MHFPMQTQKRIGKFVFKVEIKVKALFYIDFHYTAHL